MAAGVIDKLVVALGFEFDPKGLDKFKKSLETTTNTVRSLTKAVVGSTVALFGMTTASTAVTDEQGKMANQIGVSVEDLDAFETAAALAGDSAGGMSNSLKQLSIRSSEAARGMGSGVEAFGLLGVSATNSNGQLKDTASLMIEVSGALQKFDKARQVELADKLGLSSSIRLLQQGPKEINKLVTGVKELGVTTEEDAAIAAEFQDALVNMFKIVKQGGKLLSKAFAPVVLMVTDQFIEWWRINKDIIEQKLPEWIEKATKALKFLALGFGILVGAQIIATISSLISSFKGLKGIIVAINKSVLFIPALAAIAVTALLLLAQDAKTFFEGGESFLGDFIKKFPEWEGAILSVGMAFATLWDLTQIAMQGWRGLFNLISGFTVEGFLVTLRLLPSMFTQVVSDMGDAFDKFIQDLITSFPEVSHSIEILADVIKSFVRPILDLIGFSIKGISQLSQAMANFSIQGLLDVFDELPGFFQSMLMGMTSTFSDFMLGLTQMFADWVSSISMSITEGITQAFENTIENILGIGKTLKSGFSNFFGGSSEEDTSSVSGGVLPDSVTPENGIEESKPILESIKNFFGEFTNSERDTPLSISGTREEIVNAVSGAGNILGGATPLISTHTPEMQQSAPEQKVVNNHTNNNTIDIQINGAQSPQAVVDQLKIELQQASQDVASGVFQ